MQIVQVRPEDIEVPPGRRPVDTEAVRNLAASMAKIGLQTPISVWRPNGDTVSVRLVTGLHRLEAAKQLGWDLIDCVVMDSDDLTRRMWEIAENLDRSELTKLQRAELLAAWADLVKERDEFQSAQVAPIESRRSDGRGHRHASGINQAARELDIDRTEMQRAKKIDGLAPEAKTEATALGLDDNQSALLKAATAPTPAAQIASLREHAERKSALKVVPPSDIDDVVGTRDDAVSQLSLCSPPDSSAPIAATSAAGAIPNPDDDRAALASCIGALLVCAQQLSESEAATETGRHHPETVPLQEVGLSWLIDYLIDYRKGLSAARAASAGTAPSMC
jgi:ParB-like chromosome segregation protein Spo0J